MLRERMSYVMGFTFVVTFLIAVILAFAHYQTVDIVRNNELERRQATVLSALRIDTDSQDAVFAAYAALEHKEIAQDAGAGTAAGADRPVYVYVDDAGPRYARQFTGPGVWGDITAVISINADATRVVGVEILDHNETPGLGGRVTSRRFLDQLTGETIGPDGIYVATRGPGDYIQGNSRIDGITGATGTTRAFERMLNRELSDLRRILSGNGA